jgi:hypothetical protein
MKSARVEPAIVKSIPVEAGKSVVESASVEAAKSVVETATVETATVETAAMRRDCDRTFTPEELKALDVESSEGHCQIEPFRPR